MYVYTYVCMYIRMYVCMYVSVCVCVCVCVCVYVCMYVKVTMPRDIRYAQPAKFDFRSGQQSYESNQPEFNCWTAWSLCQ
jgi:hypothetical protein